MTSEQIILSQHGNSLRAHWPRRAAERLFIGKTPAQVLALVPQLFSLCGHAQTLAARLALAQAAGERACASSSELAQLKHETARETLRRWLLDWAPACGESIAPASLTALATARTPAALAALADAQLFDGARTRWRASTLHDWQHWAGTGHNAAARALHRLLHAAPEPEVQLVRLPDAANLAATLPDWLRPTGPVWHGEACDISALASYQHALQTLISARQLGAARLLARLLQLADSLDDACTPHTSAAALGDGALARVDSARGALLHLAALDGDGRISRYRIIPPTLWHAHEHGVMARAASGVPAPEARRRLLLIDPCVGFTLAANTTEEPAHA